GPFFFDYVHLLVLAKNTAAPRRTSYRYRREAYKTGGFQQKQFVSTAKSL
ncbi:MAG: hypothetical protein, partial [Olavius algarvensis spirochete endosymbiont]